MHEMAIAVKFALFFIMFKIVMCIVHNADLFSLWDQEDGWRLSGAASCQALLGFLAGSAEC